ncbi:hypothetical protein QO012_003308 [Methylobacterium aerolatum]|uniref:Uncharacterized protein n=1 Tax=Methylobacterium aerolatum TaxID=418708 RepID=A0ABU0I555_9HYPH|nr:hypothetical protein [Methylobacterium aerolatum]
MSGRVFDESASWITGTEEAEKRMITGGCTPGGIRERMAFIAESTCVIARSMLTEESK